jgi:2-amino-4-hydroxy-6-hydroxymethyldihydropteridine diphosphokinase
MPAAARRWHSAAAGEIFPAYMLVGVAIALLALGTVSLVARRLLIGRRPSAAARGLPEWAEVGRKRRAHIRRVVALIEEWADAMDVPARERDRWLRAAWLHDALRDARLPQGASHGPAAADRAARDGEVDRGVLDAIRYHSVGYAAWDDAGRMLYLADNLERGRKGRRKERARLARRVPRDRDGVLRAVVGWQMELDLASGRSIDPRTLELWNSLAED